MAPPDYAPEQGHVESWSRKHHSRQLEVESLEEQAGMVRLPDHTGSQEYSPDPENSSEEGENPSWAPGPWPGDVACPQDIGPGGRAERYGLRSSWATGPYLGVVESDA